MRRILTILLLLLLASSGCATYVIHDTVYNDYWYEQVWVADPHAALHFTYCGAWWRVWKFRVFEEGEYADTGGKGYPVVVESMK